MPEDIKKKVEDNWKEYEKLLEELERIPYCETLDAYADEQHANFVMSLLNDIEDENIHLISKYS